MDLTVVVVVVVVALVVYYIRSISNPSTQDTSGTDKTTASGFASSNRPRLELKEYTVEEVSKHNSKESCWLIIDDKVYDVTRYINDHPGGDKILIKAGDDNTKGFYGEQHPETVSTMVGEYLIGTIVSSKPKTE
eukprot:TRINITY_DN9058_c0_g1_i1.p1 TRINITY_DN9058_c0_g1~~TRINITY_DN9058_c0_g1_i1.p1  ORF type:complete len:144 (+),score=38.20 TRINITY_DN9058_c0_g1_i1:33-434(+)